MRPTLAQIFGVSVDELLGLRKIGAGKRVASPLPQKQVERLNRLPKAQQKVVMQMLEGVLSQTNRWGAVPALPWSHHPRTLMSAKPRRLDR